MLSSKQSLVSLCLLVCLQLMVMMTSNSQVAAASKRDSAGFYTTRFGRRSDPSMPVIAPAAARMYHSATGPSIGFSIEGFDDKGQAVNCLFSGSKGLYVCEKERPAEWNA